MKKLKAVINIVSIRSFVVNFKRRKKFVKKIY